MQQRPRGNISLLATDWWPRTYAAESYAVAMFFTSHIHPAAMRRKRLRKTCSILADSSSVRPTISLTTARIARAARHGFAGIAAARHSGADRVAAWLPRGSQPGQAETMLGCVAFTEQGAKQMKSLGFCRYALRSCVAAAMLAGCGGSQLPIGAPWAKRPARTRWF